MKKLHHGLGVKKRLFTAEYKKASVQEMELLMDTNQKYTQQAVAEKHNFPPGRISKWMKSVDTRSRDD